MITLYIDIDGERYDVNVYGYNTVYKDITDTLQELGKNVQVLQHANRWMHVRNQFDVCKVAIKSPDGILITSTEDMDTLSDEEFSTLCLIDKEISSCLEDANINETECYALLLNYIESCLMYMLPNAYYRSGGMINGLQYLCDAFGTDYVHSIIPGVVKWWVAWFRTHEFYVPSHTVSCLYVHMLNKCIWVPVVHAALELYHPMRTEKHVYHCRPEMIDPEFASKLGYDSIPEMVQGLKAQGWVMDVVLWEGFANTWGGATNIAKVPMEITCEAFSDKFYHILIRINEAVNPFAALYHLATYRNITLPELLSMDEDEAVEVINKESRYLRDIGVFTSETHIIEHLLRHGKLWKDAPALPREYISLLDFDKVKAEMQKHPRIWDSVHYDGNVFAFNAKAE